MPPKACKFDTDPAGAILEYVLLQEQHHAEEVAPAKTAWVTANVPLTRPQHDIWAGPASTKGHLQSILRTDYNLERRRQLDRAFLSLEVSHLLDPWVGDHNSHTEYRVASTLGKDLFLTDSYREYLHGPSFIVQRWKDSVVKIVHPTDVGIGTGFLVAGNRIATADHVFDDLPSNFVVKTEDGRTLKHGPPVRPHKDLDLDLALIPLEEEFDRRPFSLSFDCDLLDEVVVFGYPPISQSDDAYLVVNRGEVSARPSLLGSGQRVVVVSCLLRGGHSGGPVVNRRGAVVGVVSRSLFRKVADSELSLNESLGMAAATEVSRLSALMTGDIETR